LKQQILDLMGLQDLRDPLALGALTDKSYRVPPLFEPLITNGVVEQDAHEIAYFCLGGVRQAFSIDSMQLLKPACYGDSSDIPDAQTTPVRSYPSLEKLAVHNPRRVGVPISFI
jgi:hypothetical protein